jgi:ribosomal protein S18 acetylase RimI-like enzyme
MMRITCLHEKSRIEAFLRRNVLLHIYSLGDLDDFFWPYTTWYALEKDGQIQAITLMYTGASLPTLLALAETNGLTFMRDLLGDLISALPKRFYAHLSPGVEETLEERYRLLSHGEHYKMGLKDPSRLAEVDTSEVMSLTTADLGDLRGLYSQAYPGNWFEPRMLETNQYFGIRQRGRLVSAAGVHVYSPRYAVAALGNIVTHPDFRRKGYATAATAKVCASLLGEVEAIGLNVKKDNEGAIKSYTRLGFEAAASYGEYEVELT